jgi:hypothetical protein
VTTCPPTDQPALTVQVDCDLSVRKSRFQFYALVLAGDGNDHNEVILRLTDFKQTIDVAMPRSVADQIGFDLQTVGRTTKPADQSGPCHGCTYATEDHPNESGCQEWHTKEQTL